MTPVDVNEAKERLPEMLEAAARGETVLISSSDGAYIIQLTVFARPSKRLIFGGAKGEIWMSDDFDEPLPEFEEYMERVMREDTQCK